MLRKFMFIDTESLSDYYLSISDNQDINDIRKFNELYKYLEENDIIRSFQENVDEFKVGDIIEINIDIKVPKMYMQIKQVEKVAPIVGHAQSLGLLSMKSMEEVKMLEGIKGINGLVKDQEVPIIGETLNNSNKLKIVTHFDDKFLKVNLREIEGEVTIIGKIKSVVKKGKVIDVYNMMPEIDKIMPNREERRKFKKENNDFIERVSGPALEIYTLAIYR